MHNDLQCGQVWEDVVSAHDLKGIIEKIKEFFPPQCYDDNVAGLEGCGRIGVSDHLVKEGDSGGTTEVASVDNTGKHLR